MIQKVTGHTFGVLSALLISLSSSCRSEAPPKPREAESEKEPVVVETPELVMEERFAYPNGALVKRKPPVGFAVPWENLEGKTKIDDFTMVQLGEDRVMGRLDLSPSGPFGPWIDDNGKIGKDGTELFFSFYQQLVEPTKDSAAIVELVAHLPNLPARATYLAKITSGWLDIREPQGPFGIRLKREPHLAIEAPEKLNGRENLIVVKISFGLGNNDRVTYYYNRSSDKSHDGSMTSSDLSFDSISVISVRSGAQKIRHFRFADNFEMVAKEE